MQRRQVSPDVRDAIGAARLLSKRKEIHGRQHYQSNPRKSLRDRDTNIIGILPKKNLVFMEDSDIMDDDPSFTFPTHELRFNFLSAILSGLLPYTCKDESKYCRIETNYQ